MIRTVQFNEVEIPAFSFAFPAFADVLDDTTKSLPSVIKDNFVSVKGRLMSWYFSNKIELASVLFTDPDELANGVCKSHGVDLSDAYQLGVKDAQTPGVNIGGMSAEQSERHLAAIMSTSLCHHITHREMLILEATLIRAFLLSSQQRERFAMLVMWTLLCVRLSPNLVTRSPFFVDMCMPVTLSTGAQSMHDTVEQGRRMTVEETKFEWNSLLRKIKQIRDVWKDDKSFGDEERTERSDGERVHEQMVAQLIGLDRFMAPGEDITDAGRRLYQYYVSNEKND